jgi:hypothetical protein
LRVESAGNDVVEHSGIYRDGSDKYFSIDKSKLTMSTTLVILSLPFPILPVEYRRNIKARERLLPDEALDTIRHMPRL